MERKRKSRLVRSEIEQAKHEVKRYVILTGILGVFVFFFGLPIVTRFAAFIHNISSSDQPIEITDKTPPAPPQLDNIPSFVNKQALEIRGFAEPGSTVKIYVNNVDSEVVANNEGIFTAQIKIRDGENKLWAKAIDEAGNESRETNRVTITYDNTPPEISLNKPGDGESFYGANNREISVEGQTEGADKVTVNDRMAIIDQNGKFNLTIGLEPGNNEIIVRASDVAGNETELSVVVSYSE